MDDTQIGEYRRRLRDELDALKREDDLGREGRQTVSLDQQSVGRLSRMDALQQQAMARATLSRRSQRRQRVQAALARIDEGEFGYCTDCGDQIESRRLDLDPTTALCLSCARG